MRDFWYGSVLPYFAESAKLINKLSIDALQEVTLLSVAGTGTIKFEFMNSMNLYFCNDWIHKLVQILPFI